MENQNTGTQGIGTPNAQDDKLIGILSYLGILWIVAYILYGSKKTEYNLFHVKQGLGLLIAWVALYVVIIVVTMIIPFLALFLSLVYILMFILMIIGIINAANGAQKELPLLGPLTQSLLKNFK